MLRIVDFLFPLYSIYYTTIGHCIYAPSLNSIPAWVLEHEAHHLEQQHKLTAPLFLFLYCLPWFRWYFEREPFLGDIMSGVLSPEEAADELWHNYFFPWPRQLMLEWFEAEANVSRL